MKSSKICSIGLALFVPAIAAAFTVPNTFSSGEPITAAKMNQNFAALAMDVSELRSLLTTAQNSLATVGSDLATTKSELSTAKSELATVKSDIANFHGGFGPGTLFSTIANADLDVSYTAKSAGFVSAIGFNSGYNHLMIKVFVGDVAVARGIDGGSALVPIKKGESLRVAVEPETYPEAAVRLYWFPAQSGGAAPE
jgi:hypothetical protein